MRTRFQEGLDELKDKLLRMGGLAERSVGQAIAAYSKHDRKCCEDVFLTDVDLGLATFDVDPFAVRAAVVVVHDAVRLLLGGVRDLAAARRVGTSKGEKPLSEEAVVLQLAM